MIFLQLLVVFSVFLSTQQQACRTVLKLNYDTELSNRSYPCTEVYGIRIYMENKPTGHYLREMSALNSLRIIDSSNVTYRHFVSLDIQNTYLEYTPETFLPNLEKIIPAPNSTDSAIMIRGNEYFCMPKEVRDKLLNMVNGQGYIQPCACLILPAPTGIDIMGEDCHILYGPLLFNQSSILTKKMRKQLETVEELHGYIEIVNTTFTSLDFLKNLKKIVFPKWEKDQNKPVIRIEKNKNLKTVGFVVDIIQYKKKMSNRLDHVIVFDNNPRLRFHPTDWQYYDYFVQTEIDFTSPKLPVHVGITPCKVVEPASKNIKSFQNCEFVDGNLTIDSSFDDYSLEEMDEIFGYMRDLDGCLTIRGTKLTNLTFLHDLYRVYCTALCPAIIIEDNPELKMLDIQIYEFADSNSTVTVKIKNNPKLCHSEVDYLKTLVELDSPWRRIDYDDWNKDCKKTRNSMLLYYHAVVAGILIVGMVILEIVVRLIRKRREKRTAWPQTAR